MTDHALSFDLNDNGYHYGVVRRAIELIDRAEEPLSLEEIAESMGMSPAHFQRVFSQWAGVSPKRFQQYLMLGHAKTLLRERFTTLAASHAVGLSGGGRLHDLFLRWEAMSPGEFPRAGAGVDSAAAELPLRNRGKVDLAEIDLGADRGEVFVVDRIHHHFTASGILKGIEVVKHKTLGRWQLHWFGAGMVAALTRH